MSLSYVPPLCLSFSTCCLTSHSRALLCVEVLRNKLGTCELNLELLPPLNSTARHSIALALPATSNGQPCSYKPSSQYRFLYQLITKEPGSRVVKVRGNVSYFHANVQLVLFLPRPPNRVRKCLCKVRSSNYRRVQSTRRSRPFYISWRQTIYI